MNAGTCSALVLAALVACAPPSAGREPAATPVPAAPAGPAAPPDEDGDGVPDVADACCCLPEDFDGFEDEDGCPDRDNDGDGVLDAAAFEDGAWTNCDRAATRDGAWDDCRDRPENYNGKNDGDGCPEVLVFDSIVLPSARIELVVSRGRLRLPTGADARLRAVAEVMGRHPGCRCFVDTHRDTSVSRERAKQQTQAVANEVIERLVALGVARERLVPRAFGSEVPMASNREPEGRARNRRVELRVIDLEHPPRSVCERGTPREQEVCGCPKGPMTASCTYEVAKLLEELNGAR